MSGEAANTLPAPGSEPEMATAPVRGGRWVENEGDEISLFALANVLLKRWKLVVGLPLGAAFGAAVVSLLVPPKFTATATFLPEGEPRETILPAGLAGFASQFGISVPGGGNSPRFYAQVLESRTVRDQVLLVRFAVPRSEEAADSTVLLDILAVEGESESERLEKGRRELDDMVSVRVDDETSVVSISVETRHRTVSAAMANRFVELLNEFNLETRQSNVQARRQFIEERLSEAEVELRQAEEELQRFLERNREFIGSPQLEFRYERFQRQVTIKQEVLITLRRQYEEARIQEVNDTPVITTIDRAVAPDKRSSPKRTLIVIVALFAGAVVALLWAFAVELLKRARAAGDSDYHEFTEHITALKSAAMAPFRRTG